MENADIWLTPLILLPGVGLLITSTAARYGQLQGDIKQALNEKDQPQSLIEGLFQRANRFRNALAGLYASVGLFTIASLLHGLIKLIHLHMALSVVTGLTFLGMASLILASVELFRESWRSTTMIEVYRTMMERRDP